jgi:hypothetical protein
MAYQGARNPWSQASPGYGAAIAALSQAIGNLIGKKWQQAAERSGLHDQFSRSCYLPAVRHPGGRRDVRQGERIAARAPLRRPPYPSSPANRVLVMPLQAARHANLCAVVRLLEQDGLVTREAQVQFLGNPVTAFKLQAMLDGGWIGPLFAERVEHVLLKPRGWMSEVHAEEATQSAETGPLVPS